MKEKRENTVEYLFWKVEEGNVIFYEELGFEKIFFSKREKQIVEFKFSLKKNLMLLIYRVGSIFITDLPIFVIFYLKVFKRAKAIKICKTHSL